MAEVEELKKQNELLIAELRKSKDAAARAETELKKAQAIIKKKSDKQQLALLEEENDSFRQQTRALQALLRENAQDLEKYRLAAQQATAGAPPPIAGADPNQKMAELNQQIEAARKELVALEAAAPHPPPPPRPTEDGAGEDGTTEEESEEQTAARAALAQEVEDHEARVVALKTKIATLQKEAEETSSAMVSATRARDRAVREERSAISHLEDAVADRDRQLAALQTKMHDMNAANAADMTELLNKLSLKETELSDARAAHAAALAQVDESKAEIDKVKKKLKETRTARAADQEVLASTKAELDAAIAERDAAHAQGYQEAEAAAQETIAAMEEQHANDIHILNESVAAERDKCAEMTSALHTTQARLHDAEHSAQKALTALGTAQYQATSATQALELATEREEALKRKVAELEAKVEELQETTSKACAERDAAQNVHDQLTSDLGSAQNQLRGANNEVERLTNELATRMKEAEEQSVEHGIASRMLKQMNKELKKQLSAASTEVQRLEKAEAEARAALQRAEAAVKEAEAAAATANAAAAAANAAAMRSPWKQLGLSGSPAPVPLSSPAAVTTAASIAASPPSNPRDDDALKRALAQRLEMLLKENEVVREKVKYLEATIQELSDELRAKQLLIKQLSDSSAVHIDSEDSVAAALTAAATAPDQLAVTRTLLEKALMENVRLKTDMKTLAATLAGRVAEGEDSD